MRVLLDTNLLTGLINRVESDLDVRVGECLRRLVAEGHVPVVVPQNLYEFWAVATRPKEVNGLGLSVDRVEEEIRNTLGSCQLLRDSEDLFARWLDLVTRYRVSGKPSHDARLVAAMLTHGVTHLVTFNATDFERYAEVQAFTPEQVLAGALAS